MLQLIRKVDIVFASVLLLEVLLNNLEDYLCFQQRPRIHVDSLCLVLFKNLIITRMTFAQKVVKKKLQIKENSVIYLR